MRVSTMWEGRQHHNSARVWVVDHDHLILITVVLDDTLNQNIKWLAQENIVRRVVNDVELHI